MVTKLTKLIVLSVLFVLGTGAISNTSFTSTTQAQYIQLSPDQMKAALQYPNDESKEFIDSCFTLVARGKLPEALVLSAFNYAMKKPKNRWVYFEHSLKMRCDGLGIDLYEEIERLEKK